MTVLTAGSTTNGMYQCEINGEWSPPLPQWAVNDLKSILAFMGECTPEKCGADAALLAEWDSVYDRIAYMLSPKLDKENTP